MSATGPEDDPPEPRGTLRPTTARALTVCAVLGLVIGWGIHPLADALTGRPPLVSWFHSLSLVMVAAIMTFLAWHTRQTVHVRDIAKGTDLPDKVEWMRFSGLSWTKDGKGFFYSRFPEPPKGKVLEAAPLRAGWRDRVALHQLHLAGCHLVGQRRTTDGIQVVDLDRVDP